MDSAIAPITDSGRRWNMADFPVQDRFSAWCDILSRTHLGFANDLEQGLRHGFDAEVREHPLGGMALLETSVQPHRGRRTRRQVSANTRDVVGLHFVEAGRQAVALGEERVVLGPGDAMIWDGAATGDYEILEPLRKKTLIIPRSIAATVLPTYRNSFVRTLPRRHRPTRTIVEVLTTLAATLPAMDEGARRAAATLVTELLKPLDELGGGSGATARPSKLELREQVLDYIDAHLGEPTLTPATIAAAHAVSVRTLYSALDGLGVTPAAYIRTRRLARCYDDLRDGTAPVGLVARRWGFPSPSHFSRVFREHYGVAPGRVRRR